MKKAKILLTAIGIFAIVGGALAFKAKRDAFVFCSTGPGSPGLCNILVNNMTITNIVRPVKGFCTTNPNFSCLNIRQLTYLD